MKKGYTMVEALIYLGIFAMISVLIASLLYSFNRSSKIIQSSVYLETLAQTTLEQITRNVKNSTSINTVSSVFSDPNGTLSVNGLGENGATTTSRFFLEDGQVKIEEPGLSGTPLSSDKVRVLELYFYPITTPKSSAVRIVMHAETGEGQNYKEVTFYTTAVLRGSYQP